MSYGKNNERLAQVGGYGASPTQQMGNAGRRQQGPRKGSPSWANNYMPSESNPDDVRLIAVSSNAERIDPTSGDAYVETVSWHEYTEHFHATLKRSSVCSAGVFRRDKQKARPCRGCEIYWEDWNERQRIAQEKGVKRVDSPDRCSSQSKYAFNILVMAWFFKGQRTDKNGAPSIDKKTGRPFMDWIQYEGPHQDALFHSAPERRQGLVKTFPANYGQFMTLNAYSDIVQKHCKSCGSTDCIHIHNHVCPNCNGPTLQGHQTTMPPEKVREVVNQPVVCQYCTHKAYPRAILSCMHCPNPTPATIFDVDLRLMRVKVNQQNTMQVIGSSAPRPIHAAYVEAARHLVDMEVKFAITPYEEQLKIFGAPAGPSNQHMAPPGAGYGYTTQPQQWGQPAQQWGQPAQPAQPAQQWGQPQQAWPQQPQQPQQYPQPGQPQQAWQPQVLQGGTINGWNWNQ